MLPLSARRRRSGRDLEAKVERLGGVDMICVVCYRRTENRKREEERRKREERSF